MRNCFQTSDNPGADDTSYCHFWFRNWHYTWKLYWLPSVDNCV